MAIRCSTGICRNAQFPYRVAFITSFEMSEESAASCFWGMHTCLQSWEFDSALVCMTLLFSSNRRLTCMPLR